jgi:hypothetical protein
VRGETTHPADDAGDGQATFWIEKIILAAPMAHTALR